MLKSLKLPKKILNRMAMGIYGSSDYFREKKVNDIDWVANRIR